MTKQKKKRNKKYQGSDAKNAAPTVLRVSAEERGPVKDWWLNHKTMIRITSVITTIGLVLVLIVTGLIGLFNG